jgi:hypothetical protein
MQLLCLCAPTCSIELLLGSEPKPKFLVDSAIERNEILHFGAWPV